MAATTRARGPPLLAVHDDEPHVHHVQLRTQRQAYLNVLVDWNQDGD
jgi:hypothetical protein